MDDLLSLPKPKQPLVRLSSFGGLLWWLMMIFVFVGLYQGFWYLSARNGDPMREWVSYASMTASIALVFGWIIAVRWRTARFNRENNEAVALLRKGVVARASDAFEQLVRRYRWPRDVRLVARLNGGIARLRIGEPKAALELLEPIMRQPLTQALASAEAAVAHAFLGQLDQAAKCLDRAMTTPGADVHTLVWPRALVAARRGELALLARRLDEKWRELEGSLTGETLRSLTLLRAFALATLAGPRGPGDAEPLLARVRPVSQGEFAWLTVGWPELAAFLAANQLG
jgi:hypothetical protein